MEEINEIRKKPIDPYAELRKKRKSRILLISWNVHPGKDFAQVLQAMDNIELVWVGKEAPDMDFTNLPVKQFIYNGPFGSIPLAVRKFSLKSILDIFGYDFDLILHLQDWTVFTDVEKSSIPYIYYHSEAFYPEVPYSAWKVLGATEFIQEFLQHKYGSRFKYDYLPFALRNDLIRRDVNEEKRTIKSSFAGELHHFDQMYDERRNVIKYLENVLPRDIFETHYLSPYGPDPKVLREPEAGLGRLNGKTYTELLLRSQIGINVPTGDNTNFRDFEIPGLGAMLLTKKTRDLVTLGFKDGINCMFYKTKEEAEEIIKNGFDPEIAKAGYLHVITNHTYFKRMNYLLDPVMSEYCRVEEN